MQELPANGGGAIAGLHRTSSIQDKEPQGIGKPREEIGTACPTETKKSPCFMPSLILECLVWGRKGRHLTFGPISCEGKVLQPEDHFNEQLQMGKKTKCSPGTKFVGRWQGWGEKEKKKTTDNCLCGSTGS